MGILADALRASGELPPEAPADAGFSTGVAGEVGKGLRSSLTGMGAGLQAVAGTVGEVLGADEFAKNRHADAKALRRQAQQEAPRVNQWGGEEGVNNARDFVHYAAGLTGGVIPSVALGVGAGFGARTALGAMTRSAAALAPVEAGDVALQQQGDPEAMAQSPGERLTRQVVGGGASAFAQGVVPGLVAGKLAGRGAAAAAERGVGRTLASNAAAMPAEGAFEGAGDVIKQFATNDAKPLDWDQVKESAIGGMVGAGPLAALGAAGDLTHGGGRRVAQAGRDALQGTKDALTPAWQAVVDATPDGVKATLDEAKTAYQDLMGADDVPAAVKAKAKEMATNFAAASNRAWLATAAKMRGEQTAPDATEGSLGDFLRTAGEKPDDTADRILAGQPLGDLKAMASATGERLTQMVQQGSAKATEWAQRTAASLRSREDLSPEQRAQLDADSSPATVATIAKAKSAWDAVATRINALAEGVKKGYEQGKTGAKKSEDYSGYDQLILQKIGPTIFKALPEAQHDARTINQLAGTLRMLGQYMAAGDTVRTKALASKLSDAIGADTAHTVLSDMADVVTGGDPAKHAAFFKALNEQIKDDVAGKELVDVVAKYSSNEAPERSGVYSGPKDWADALRKYADGAFGSTLKDPKAEVENTRFLNLLQQHFGTKTKAILAAAEKDYKRRNAGAVSEDGSKKTTLDSDEPSGDHASETAANEARGTDAEKDIGGWYHSDKSSKGKPTLYMETKADRARADRNQSFAPAVDQAIEKLRAENPDSRVRFVPLSEYAKENDVDAAQLAKGGNPENWGYLKVEHLADDKLTPIELKRMAMDTTKHGAADHPSRLTVKDADGKSISIFDAVKVTREFTKKINAEGSWTKEDDVSGAHRMARAFLEGSGRLMTEVGPFNVPDSTVIGYLRDGSKLTFGDTKKLKQDAGDNFRDVPKGGERQVRRTMSDAAAEALPPTSTMADDADVAAGKQDPDKAGNIHVAAARMKPDDLQHRVGMDGSVVGTGGAAINQNALDAVGDMATKVREKGGVGKDKIADRLMTLTQNAAMMSKGDLQKLYAVSGMTKFSDVTEATNALATKYKDRIVAKATPPAEPSRAADKEDGPKEIEGRLKMHSKYLDNPPANYTSARARDIADWAKDTAARLKGDLRGMDKDSDAYDVARDQMWRAEALADQARTVLEGDTAAKKIEEGSPDPKAVAAKKAAFLEKARSGDAALLQQLSTSDDAKGLQRAVDAMFDARDSRMAKTLDAANKRLGELIARSPDVAYGLQTKRYSLDATAASNPDLLSAKGRQQIRSYIHSVLGDTVDVEFAMLPHAGEYTEAIVRVSVAALNPTSVAYHESLHAFFDQLLHKGSGDVVAVLEKAASTPRVMAQLRKLLAHSPEALAQLKDPEERAAYMYQFWAAGQLDLNGGAKSLFTKLREAFAKLMGVWTNDQRALHIMEYFSSGEYAANLKNHDAVREALMGAGRNATLDKLRDMTKPFLDLAEAAVGAGSANLRDTDIPALMDLADRMKKQGTDVGDDPGYLPAARLARTKFLSQYAEVIDGASTTELSEALEALQNGREATGKAEEVRVGVRKVLDDMFAYLHKAGVNVADLGVGKDYFPRRWDPHYMSKNKEAFMDMARKYPDWHAAEETFNKLVTNDGSELQVVDKPGMSSLMQRELSFISHADAAPFMTKDLHGILNSYITQATRRAEWARRFDDTGEAMGRLYEQAKIEGATDKQIAEAKRFVAGVNGTLGDDLNPTLRRYMGNMIVYQNIRLLPLAVFSMAVDPMGTMVRGGTVGDAWASFKRGIREIPKGLRGDTSADEATQLAMDLGTIDNAMLQHAIGSTYTQGVVGDTARKINDTFFRYNLVEQMNTSMRVGATQAARRFLAKHAGGDFSQHSTRYLSELGLKPSDIVVKDGDVLLTEAEGLTSEQAAKMRSAVNQWVDGAVLRPDAADKPVWMNDPHFMLFGHLKQFVYAFQHTILSRMVHEYKHGNYVPAMALASYVPMMIAADLAKGFIQGGGDQPEWKKGWDMADYLGNGIQRAGLLGVGQLGVDVLGDIKRGDTGLGALMGPTVGQLGDAVETIGGRKQFSSFATHSLPANQLFNAAFGAERPDPTFSN